MTTSTILGSTSVDLSDALAALADPVRRQIVRVLADGGHCVCDIRDAVPVAANLLSYHLRVLRDAGLVSATRRGRWVDYRLVGDGFAGMWAQAGAAGVPLPGAHVSDRMTGSACEDLGPRR